MTEAIETTLAARELAEKVAAAREEQREACARHLRDEILSTPTQMHAVEIIDAVRSTPLTFTPRADRINALEAELTVANGTIAMMSTALVADAESIAGLRADLSTAAAVMAELQLEKEAAERALTGANVEASLLRSQLASARVGPDQVVLLQADYERLIASLPVRPRLSVVENAPGASTPQPPSET